MEWMGKDWTGMAVVDRIGWDGSGSEWTVMAVVDRIGWDRKGPERL